MLTSGAYRTPDQGLKIFTMYFNIASRLFDGCQVTSDPAVKGYVMTLGAGNPRTPQKVYEQFDL
jgi:hypothetical protein